MGVMPFYGGHIVARNRIKVAKVYLIYSNKNKPLKHGKNNVKDT